MIDPKYSLKYSFPHSVVHIVDNSMYTGEQVVENVEDPSLFSTIVVTGLPMGEDNKIINITRSDVLNTGFGINTLTTSDINKYSQAVEYPTALLNQNVPVKLLRITPDDATYGLAVIMVQWKKNEYIKNNKFEVRFKVLSEDAIKTTLLDLSEYKNVARLNKAIVTKFNNREDDSVYEYTLTTTRPSDWNDNYSNYSKYVNGRYVPAAPGAPVFETETYYKKNDDNTYTLLGSEPADWETNYANYYTKSGEDTYVPVETQDPPTWVEGMYYSKTAVWNQRVFMTIISAGRGSAYNRMRFFVNKTPQGRRQTAVTYNFGTVDTLNGLTVENFTASLINASNSVMSTDAINNNSTKIDTVNIAVAKRVEGSSVLVPTVNEQAVQEIFNEYMAYFRSKKEIGDTEYANYGLAYDEIYKSLNSSKFDLLYGMFTYKDSTFKLPYYQVDMYDVDIPKLPEDQLVKLQKTADSDTQLPYKAITTYGATIDSMGVIVGNVDVAAPAAIFETHIKQAISRTFDDNNATAPGDLYIAGVNSTSPYLVLVTSVNLKNGAVTTMPFAKVRPLNGSAIDTDVSHSSVSISKVISNISPLYVDSGSGNLSDFVAKINNVGTTFAADDVIAVTGIYKGTGNSERQFHLYKVTVVTTDGKISTLIPYPGNLYSAIDYGSNYLGIDGVDAQICRKSQEASKPLSFSRLGSLYINDVSTDYTANDNVPNPTTGEVTPSFENINCQPKYLAYFDATGEPMFKTVSAYAHRPNAASAGTYGGHITVFRAFTSVPSGIAVNVNTEIIGEQFDVLVFDTTADVSTINPATVPADYIFRCNVQSAINNTYRVTYAASIDVPANYYVEDYGDILYTSAKLSTSEGGVEIVAGSTGFFDDNLSEIEFKWKYSALLVKAFRGEIDPRILSPVRVPAFYMFDAGFNTVVGMNVLPYTTPNVEDVIYASTLFTEDEKESVLYDKSLIANITAYEDIDVKQAMYDLMIERVYQRIPEENRPVGPGSGLSLHLDSGITNAETAIAVNNSFRQRFDNPNASWDIGGYVDANNGVSYTYLMQIIKNCFTHYRNFTINKPFVGDYSAINKLDYLSFFPDLDATDWEMRELYYNSGGNAWIMDVQGNLTRRSQRSLYREETGTSDLYQESNMRTLSQFVYLIQTEIDHYLLEYNDDGVIKTMQETVNNKFAGWAGNLVESYDISFKRDYNTDGGDILICNVNVVFRGLILRVPIIVNVNRRNG